MREVAPKQQWSRRSASSASFSPRKQDFEHTCIMTDSRFRNGLSYAPVVADFIPRIEVDEIIIRVPSSVDYVGCLLLVPESSSNIEGPPDGDFMGAKSD